MDQTSCSEIVCGAFLVSGAAYSDPVVACREITGSAVIDVIELDKDFVEEKGGSKNGTLFCKKTNNKERLKIKSLDILVTVPM